MALPVAANAARRAWVADKATSTLMRVKRRQPTCSCRRGEAAAEDASARTPVFDTTLLRDGAVVVAVGSHERDARELDSSLFGRATVIVEDVAAALREAGDVVLAIADGALTRDDLVPMADVVTGAVDVPADRPLVFKSVGMSWQDLVVAEAVLARSEA